MDNFNLRNFLYNNTLLTEGYTGKTASNIELELVYNERGEAIFKDNKGNAYIFHPNEVKDVDYDEYVSKDSQEDADNLDITDDVIENYVNDNLAHLSMGKGLADYESGKVDLVLIDDELEEFLGTKIK